MNASVRYSSLAILLLSVPLSGCFFGAGGYLPSFSPNDSVFAFVAEDYVSEPWVDGHKIITTQYVCWCRTTDPDKVRRARVGTLPRAHRECDYRSVNYGFSCDSRHIGATLTDGVLVIETDSGRCWRAARGEIVSSFQFRGDDELVYVTHSQPRGKWNNVTDRVFWRQKIGEPESRAGIYGEKGTKAGADSLSICWPLEKWSPKGNYVVFMSPFHRGRFHLLEVESGQVRQFGRGNSHLEEVVWKADESSVLCVAHATGGEQGPPEMLVVAPGTGGVIEWSERHPYVRPTGFPSQVLKNNPNCEATSHDGTLTATVGHRRNVTIRPAHPRTSELRDPEG